MKVSSWKRRRRWPAAAVALSVVLVGACGGGDGNETATADDEKPVAGGNLLMALEADSPGWFPPVQSGKSLITTAIYDTLMAEDSKGVVKPYMAESLTPNADFTQWTLKLRPGITFHDNTPLDAEAIRKGMMEYHKAQGSQTSGTTQVITGVTVVDPLTARYDLAGPNGAFPSLLTGVIGMPFSPAAVEAAGGKEKFSSGPVGGGAGPFMFVSWQRDNALVMKKNPNYWQKDKGLPYLDQITTRPIPDEDARLATLQSGDVDLMQTVRQAHRVKAAADDGSIKSYPDIGNTNANLNLNMGKPPTNDIRVRKAMAYAVDQKQLISVQGLEGIAPVAKQLFNKDSPYYSTRADDAYAENDMNRAKALMREYINDPARSDGKPVGTPPTLAITCTAGVSSLNDLVLIYQQKWKEAGLEASLDLVDQAVLVQKLVGVAPDFKAGFDVSCNRSGTDDDPDVLYNTLAVPNIAANLVDMDDARVRELFQQGRASGDP